MTIKDVADQRGTTVQRVYKKLKDNGIDIKQLKDPKTGEITADGEFVISQVFNTHVNKNNRTESAIVSRLQSSVERVESENSLLRDQIKQLKEQIEDLRSQLRIANDLNLKLADRPQDHRRGIFGFLTGRKKTEDD